MRSVLLAALVVLIASGLATIAQSQSNPHYTTADPALREMLISMDMPRYAGSVPAANVAGNWHFMMSDGAAIDLNLLQSGAAVFGRGNLTANMFSQGAFASGSVSGSSLQLGVVPESGRGLYAISIDISGLPLTGTYVMFSADAAPVSGRVQASTSAITTDIMMTGQDITNGAATGHLQ